MNVKIINLFSDAILPNTSLKGKRGNSFYLEFEKEKILFDTGSNGELLLHNMNILGISPNSIDKIVLSHGHFDHTRGIENFLKNRTKSDKILIIAHPDFQQQRYVTKYGFGLQDKIYVKSEGIGVPYHVKIVGIVDDLTAESIYVSIDTAQKILNKTGLVNTMYFTVDNNIDDTCKKIEALPFIELVVKKEKITDDIAFTVEMFSTLIGIFGIIFTVFGIILIVIIIKSIIEYRLEDYGNMKAVGLLNSELKKPLRFELLFYFLGALFIGLILGYITMVGLIEMYSYVLPGLQLKIYPISYMYFVLNVIFMLVITYIFNIRKVKKNEYSRNYEKKDFWLNFFFNS